MVYRITDSKKLCIWCTEFCIKLSFKKNIKKILYICIMENDKEYSPIGDLFWKIYNIEDDVFFNIVDKEDETSRILKTNADMFTLQEAIEMFKNEFN